MLQLMEECLPLRVRSCSPSGQGCGGSPAEERGENLVSCVRNLPGWAMMFFLCDQAAAHFCIPWLQCILKVLCHSGHLSLPSE